MKTSLFIFLMALSAVSFAGTVQTVKDQGKSLLKAAIHDSASHRVVLMDNAYAGSDKLTAKDVYHLFVRRLKPVYAAHLNSKNGVSIS